MIAFQSCKILPHNMMTSYLLFWHLISLQYEHGSDQKHRWEHFGHADRLHVKLIYV